ncbi:MAG: C2 family cysteine protease [Myxococcaceae bacterium]|nr:C2 family cysteine protease [Myxococcaceae bacterium]
MPQISDRRLSSLYSTFEAQHRSNPSLKLGQEQVFQLLAQIGDRSGWSSNKVLAELKKPGVSREQQVALVQRGMTASEKRDLAAIVDSGQVPLEPSAKQFLDAVLGRSTTVTPPPTNGLTITGDQKNGLSGITKAGAQIEAINLSTAPTGRYRVDDTMVVGKAGQDGRFDMAKLTGDMAMREGDVVRIRARYDDGSTSDWVTINAKGLETRDTRNAAVALFRIGLSDAGNGKIAVTNINASRQISEPGARLQLTNNRTRESFSVTLDDKGNFPANFTVNGRAGDSFTVAATDGKNNVDFREAVGNVTVPGGQPGTQDLVPDPALHKDELDAAGKPRFSKARFTGPLFIDGPKAEDVAQGQIGNCYFPAAMAAIAKINPDAITRMIKDNGDGTFTVTFKQRDWATGRFKDVPVKVDADLYVRSFGGPLYGRSTNSNDARQMELWYPLVEKAYAQWKGSYNDIGNGGLVNDVFEACLGQNAEYMALSWSNETRVFDTIKRALDAKKPVGAGTFGSDESSRYTNTGVYADHAYSILGYEQQGTEKLIVLRNPWAESEPRNNGPNDGIFKLKVSEFMKLFQSLMWVE